MEGYQMHMECIIFENRTCGSCGYCKEIESQEAYLGEYEPTDAEIEAEIERKMAEAEAMADNL